MDENEKMKKMKEKIKEIKNVKKTKKFTHFTFCLIIFLFFLFSSQFLAQEYEQKNLSIVAKGVENLIKVNYEKNFSNLIPNLEYSSNLTVEFAISNESLANLRDDRVFIFVKLNSTTENFYFKKNGEKTNTYSTVLRCYVINGKCSNESNIIERVTFYIKLKSLGEEKLGEFIVSASVYPIHDEEKYIKLNESLYEIIKEKKSLNLTEEERAKIEKLIKEIKDSLSNFRIEEATEKINYLKEYLSNISKRYNLTKKLEEISEKVNSSLSLDLDEKQKEIIENIKLELENLRENLEKGNYSTINEKLDEIEYKLSKIYLKSKESNEWIFYLIIVALAVFILLLAISFLKK